MASRSPKYLTLRAFTWGKRLTTSSEFFWHHSEMGMRMTLVTTVNRAMDTHQLPVSA